MGYVAAKGGFTAIRAAEDLVRRRRMESPSSWLEVDQITERLGYAVDRVMGEGGLWDETTAAIALRQSGGDVIEASHVVRAHRSTLPRFADTVAVSTDELEPVRRIVPAFRETPGPQLLGHTLDYAGRLLERVDEDQARRDAADSAARRAEAEGDDAGLAAGGTEPGPVERLLEVLRKMDLVVDRRDPSDPEPVDITRVPARPGAPRSARLATMARAESGALVQLWYRNILGPDDHLHEVTLGEVRHGRLPVRVRHPRTGGEVTIGRIRVTEVEAIEDLDGNDEDRTRFDVGYGLCFGHNERKAIAMANLDIAMSRDGGRSPLEQSVLMTSDGLDSAGFLEHLKLPHYVTFRSMVERKSAMRATGGRDDRPAGATDDAAGRSDCGTAELR